MTENSARFADHSEAHSIPPGAVVVGVDGSEPALAAVRWAAQEAAYLGRPLHLLAVQEYLPGTVSIEDPMPWSHYQDRCNVLTSQILRAASQEAANLAPDVPLTSACVTGRPSEHLIDASKHATCVVVGNRGQGRLAATMLGTVSLQVAAHAPGPVVVVRAWSDDQRAAMADGPRRAVVGVDDSEQSRHAIRFALEHVGPQGQVELVIAWWLEVVDGLVVTSPGSSGWEQVTQRHREILLEALRAATGGTDDPRVTLRVERGHPAQTLGATAASPQHTTLTVVGTRGRGGFAGLVLGSVSQQVLVSSTGPVAVA